jgi:acyl-CoA oxidase
MVYIAWSDGALTATELEALGAILENQSWLDDEGRTILRSWLRADSPPSPSQLNGLRDRMRGLWPEDRHVVPPTLAGLGLELIRACGLTVGPWSEDGAPERLAEAERLLGVNGPDAVRTILGEGVLPRARGRRPTFRPETLHAYLDSTRSDLRNRVLALLATPEFAIPLESDMAHQRTQVLQAVQTLAQAGVGAAAYPAAAGGADDPGATVAVFETLAYGDLSILVKFGVQFGLFGGSVLHLGTERHHKTYLPRIGRLDLPGCYAMTEVGHGSNVRDLETTATYDSIEREFVVHTPSPEAVKDWIGNAALHGRVATVFARLLVAGEDHGVHALLVPIRSEDGRTMPGVTITDRGPKEGLNGVDNGQISFENVRVPRENLLNRFADVSPEGVYASPIPSADRRFFTMLGTLVSGRVSIGAAAVSVSKTALTIGVRYADRRRQFGPTASEEVPILDYLHVQRLLLPRLAKTYALHFGTRELIRRFEAMDETTARQVEVLAAGLKAEASWHAIDTAQAGREACGGAGYAAENRFGRLKADVDVFATFEGANAVLLQLVAKGLLSEFRDEMGDLKVWGIVRHLADRAQTRVAEMNPVTTRRTDAEHLRDPDFHEAAFAYREERLLRSAAVRIKGFLDGGFDAFDAMNRTQDHLIELARASVARFLLACLREGVAKAPAPGISEVLRSVGALYALSTMEEARGWYLEAGYLEPAKSRAIRAEVNELCAELRDEAVFLVDAFGIPDEVLRAPAGLKG